MMRLLRRWTPGQWALRSTCVVGVLVALAATGLLGVWPAWWLVALVGGLACCYAVAPEASFGTVAMALVVFWWGVAFRDGLHPQALVAAAGLVAAHVAGVLAAYGPDRMAVDRPTVLLWVRRGALVFLVSPLVWAVAEVLRDQPEPDGIWVAGLVAAMACVAAVGAVLVAGKVPE